MRNMGLDNINRIVFFCFLIMMITSGNYATSNNENRKLMNDHMGVLRLHSMDSEDTAMHTHHATSSMHMMSHINPALMVVFFIQDLKIGNKMQIYFPKKNPLSVSRFLPKEKADSIPFSSKQLPNILSLFSFPQGSPKAKAMDETLRQCEAMPIQGEAKLCATSYESMLEFARGLFGLGKELEALSTRHLAKSNKNILVQNYTILEVPKEVLSNKRMVACHTVPYPYVVLYCHYQILISENKVFKVVLEGETSGERVEAVAVCHMDTSHWSPNHALFKVLGVKRGSHICHFLPADNLVWVEKLST